MEMEILPIKKKRSKSRAVKTLGRFETINETNGEVEAIFKPKKTIKSKKLVKGIRTVKKDIANMITKDKETIITVKTTSEIETSSKPVTFIPLPPRISD